MKKLLTIVTALSLILITLTQTIQCKGDQEASPLSQTELQKTGGLLLPHTPVKDQGSTSACWIYAYLACIETERIANMKDSINLSPAWLIRSMFCEQSKRFYLSKGATEITARGIGPEAERLIKKHGMVPWSNYKFPDNINTNVISRDLTNKINIAIRGKKGLTELSDIIDETLPRVPHNLNDGFYLFSAHYTPQEFSRSLLYGLQFQWMTSYTHHPFGQAFDLEIPDNIQHHKIMNVPIDTLYQQTITALRNHHPVFWEGDMDYNPKTKTTQATIQEKRQKAFETFQVKDQHAMAIIGIAKDKNGDTTLICKNSWGKEWGRKGFYLMPKQQFLINTIMIGIVKPCHKY